MTGMVMNIEVPDFKCCEDVLLNKLNLNGRGWYVRAFKVGDDKT